MFGGSWHRATGWPRMASSSFMIVAVLGVLLFLVPLYFLADMGHRKIAGWLTLGLFGAVLALFWLDDAITGSRREALVRSTFKISDDVQLGRILGGERTPVCYRRAVYYRTRVQFTPAQFEAYAAMVRKPGQWLPGTPHHYAPGKTRFSIADDAFAWRELPAPGFAGRQRLVWRIASSDVWRGLAFCYDIARAPGDRAPGARTAYRVSACEARKRDVTQRGGGHVEAALDFDKQHLNLTLHFDSKPHFCRNRVSRFISGVWMGLW